MGERQGMGEKKKRNDKHGRTTKWGGGWWCSGLGRYTLLAAAFTYAAYVMQAPSSLGGLGLLSDMEDKGQMGDGEGVTFEEMPRQSSRERDLEKVKLAHDEAEMRYLALKVKKQKEKQAKRQADWEAMMARKNAKTEVNKRLVEAKLAAGGAVVKLSHAEQDIAHQIRAQKERDQKKLAVKAKREANADPTLETCEDGECEDPPAGDDPVKYNMYRQCARQNPQDPKPKPNLEGLPVTIPEKVGVDNIFLTKKNAKVLKMDKEVKNMNSLAPSMDTVKSTYTFRSCGVVGNGGGMKHSHMGDAINSHDVVLRLNQAPVEGYKRFVGYKTSFRMLNNLWTERYARRAKFEEEREAILPLERKVTLIISRANGHEYDDLYSSVRKDRSDVAIILLSSRTVSSARRLLTGYRSRMCEAGYGPYPGGSTPSSGFVAVYLMLQLCDQVSVYGFGTQHVR